MKAAKIKVKLKYDYELLADVASRILSGYAAHYGDRLHANHPMVEDSIVISKKLIDKILNDPQTY